MNEEKDVDSTKEIKSEENPGKAYEMEIEKVEVEQQKNGDKIEAEQKIARKALEIEKVKNDAKAQKRKMEAGELNCEIDQQKTDIQPKKKKPNEYDAKKNEKSPQPFTKTFLQYKLEGIVGEGTFGKVYKGIKNSEQFGIKRIHNADGLHITTIREIKYLRSCTHRNIVELLEINLENSELFLVFPFYRFDLHFYLKKNIPNKREIIHIIKQIAEGLEYLESKNILHRDIKSKNILMDFNLNVKLADFGMATTTTKSQNYSPGVVTLWYRPPEILLNMSYGFPCDVWGLGCILGELLQGRAVFTGNTELKVLECIVLVCGSINSRTLPNLQELEITIPQSMRNLRKIFKACDKDLVNLLDKILVINPKERFTIEEILKDSVFDGYDREFINEIAKRYNEEM